MCVHCGWGCEEIKEDRQMLLGLSRKEEGVKEEKERKKILVNATWSSGVPNSLTILML